MANNIPVYLLAFANDRQGRFLRSIATENQTISRILQNLDSEKYGELIVLADAKIEDILRTFKEKRDRIRLFHYGGHANGYGLLMASSSGGEEVADAASFAQFLSQQKNLKLVFLNGCSTEEQAKGLLEAGIENVIVTNQDINDSAAQKFSSQFYESLASGAPIAKAFDEASSGVLVNIGSNTRSIFWEELEEEPEGLPWMLLTRDNADLEWHPKLSEHAAVIEDVKKLIGRSKLDKAIKLFKEHLKAIDEEKYDELLLLEGKNKDGVKKARIGVIDNSDLTKIQQQVAYGVLEIAKSLTEEEED